MRVKKMMKKPDVYIEMGKVRGRSAEVLSLSYKKDKTDFKKEDFQSLLKWHIASSMDRNKPSIIWRTGTLKEKNKEGVPIQCFIYVLAGTKKTTVANDAVFTEIQNDITRVATMALRMQTFIKHRFLNDNRVNEVIVFQAPEWMQKEVAKQLNLKVEYY